MSEKYPRMPHLPWSEGLSKDDYRSESVGSLLGVELVITEKADGSNVCLERRAVFARSHTGTPRHPSFDALKARHAALQFQIAEYSQIFAEWLWARHSIAYDKLPDTLLVFGVRNTDTNIWLSWDEMEAECTRLGLLTVPVLWRGTVETETGLRRQIKRLTAQCRLGSEQEGLVVRVDPRRFPMQTLRVRWRSGFAPTMYRPATTGIRSKLNATTSLPEDRQKLGFRIGLLLQSKKTHITQTGY